MDEQDLLELYKIIKRGYDNSNWDSIQESMDYISEFIDLEDEFIQDELI